MNIFCITISFLSLLIPTLASAAEAFLEPNQLIEIRSPFQAMVQTVHVEEGQTVQKGDLLLELDSRTFKARERLLQKISTFHAVLDSAKAIVKMQQDRLAMVEKLTRSGNARKKELEKVKTDLAISRAKLLEAREKQEQTLIELEIARIQVKERRFKSPLAAVVLKIYRQHSEMASPTDSEPAISLVQLDPLLAVFHLPVQQALKLSKGDDVTLLMQENTVPATIDFVSPVIEAQSGTIRVRFRVPNPEGKLLSGSRVSYESR